MRGLSLTEPWATLVAHGKKQWETRGWKTPYRGPIAIHASKGMPGDCMDLCHEEPFRSTLAACGITGPADFYDATRGKILAVADLTNCVLVTPTNAPGEPEYSFGDYTPGRWMWRIENVRLLDTPVPCKGSLGLWVVTADVLASLDPERP